MWDVFIGHASEDKSSVVRPLVDHLKRLSIRVWVDYEELVPGDSLRERIEEGLIESRYGLVVLSSHFFAKQWPRLELDGLFALDRVAAGHLIPVWHGLSHRRISQFSPLLAGRFALKTSEGIPNVARSVHALLRKRGRLTPYDRQMEELISEYDTVSDTRDSIRIPRKLAIRDSMMRLGSRIRDPERYFSYPTEGGRLAYVSLLQQGPRRNELLRLVEICKLTKHRFVWIEACLAIDRTLEVCKISVPERERVSLEANALRARRLYKKSSSVRETTAMVLASLAVTGHDQRISAS